MYKSEQYVSDDAILDCNELRLSQILDNIMGGQQSILLEEDRFLLQTQEETMDGNNKPSMDIGLVSNHFTPVSPIGPPDRENFSGDLNFEVAICGADTNRSKYVYSHLLDRIYVDMGYGFSVQLKWDVTLQPGPTMLVRATPVFCDQTQAEKRVTRCTQHYHDTKNDASMSEAMRKGVLHSTRDVGTLDVFYCGDEMPDVWYSVVVRLAAPTTHAYQFACKNSCSSGINRRAIAIIFTLEDYTGKVFGRQSVGARVCSCPKRDLRHDEEAEVPRAKRPLTAGKRANSINRPPVSSPKKIRLEVRQDDTNSDVILQLPPITVVGRPAFNAGLGVILTVMEEKLALAARANQPTEQLEASIAQLKQSLAKSNEELMALGSS